MYENLPELNNDSKVKQDDKVKECQEVLNGWLDVFLTSQEKSFNDAELQNIRENLYTLVNLLGLHHVGTGSRKSEGLTGNLTSCKSFFEIAEKVLSNEILVNQLTERDFVNKKEYLTYILVKSIKELEEENRKLKQGLSSKKQKLSALEAKYKEVLDNKKIIAEETNKARYEAAAEGIIELEEKVKKLEDMGRRQQLVIKSGSSILIFLAVTLIDLYILSTNLNNWNNIAKVQKTFVISSVPVLASLVTLIFFGSQKSAKIVSIITAVVGLIVGIYKCF
mgnify:CR=1 FL=1